MATVKYVQGQELPDLALDWKDSNGNYIDFSTGYTFEVKVAAQGAAASSFTQTTGITGASTSPNLTIAWTTSNLSALLPGHYRIRIRARRVADSKDRYYLPDGDHTQLVITADFT